MYITAQGPRLRNEEMCLVSDSEMYTVSGGTLNSTISNTLTYWRSGAVKPRRLDGMEGVFRPPRRDVTVQVHYALRPEKR